MTGHSLVVWALFAIVIVQFVTILVLAGEAERRHQEQLKALKAAFKKER